MHYQLNEHELEQTLGVREGKGGLACCSPLGCRESDTTERLNNNRKEDMHVDTWDLSQCLFQED